MESEQICEHIINITAIKEAEQYVCEECIKTGDHWVHLRTCQTCGISSLLVDMFDMTI